LSNRLVSLIILVMATHSVCLIDLTSEQLQKLVISMGEPAYRAKQLLSGIYRRLAFSFNEMTDLPASFREKLQHKVSLHSLTMVEEMTSRDGTIKTLFSLADGSTIEATLMPYPAQGGRTHHTTCVSTQVGCPIGCPFCATGQQGFERNLTPGEIIDQVLYFARKLKDRGSGSIDNIVFMGMGEPLANYDALWQAIEMLNSPDGFRLAARSMTISTAGLVPQIDRLSKANLQVGLAISLHASNNALRDKLVPLNRRYPLEQLIPAVREYFRRTGRRPSFEYILFDRINDSPEDAHALAELLSGLTCHVNLIPANPTGSADFQPPAHGRVLAFQREVKSLGITCTLRRRKGIDIAAGCGQLRSRLLKSGRPTTKKKGVAL